MPLIREAVEERLVQLSLDLQVLLAEQKTRSELWDTPRTQLQRDLKRAHKMLTRDIETDLDPQEFYGHIAEIERMTEELWSVKRKGRENLLAIALQEIAAVLDEDHEMMVALRGSKVRDSGALLH